MLQQLRRNVREHVRSEETPAIGLAIVRVWTGRSLSDEWGLTEDAQHELLRAWDREPVPTILHNLGAECGILQVSVVDDGQGIPKTLEEVHRKLCSGLGQGGLFPERLHYSKPDFEKRFAEPASWSDANARLIAFATDELGTSKHDRAPEVKGLQYLSGESAIKKGGALLIESDGSLVSYFTREHPYGQPGQGQPRWCQVGGAGVCLAVPMSPVESIRDTRPTPAFGVSPYSGSGAPPFKIREHLGKSTPEDVQACAVAVLKEITLQETEDDVTNLRKKGLLVIDWGELLDSKRTFHSLLVDIAQGLAALSPRCMRPFVFANLPKGLCGMLETAIKKYSTEDNPTPVYTFTAEQKEPFWLGLDGDNSIPAELRAQVNVDLRRKLNDDRENRTEGYYRSCLTKLLDQGKPIAPSDDSVLDCVRPQSRQLIQRSASFTRLKALISRCALFREEERPVYADNVFTGRFQPVFRREEIEAEVRTLFLDEFREVFTKSPVCFIPPSPTDGVKLPHSSRVVRRYFRSDALVDDPIAEELTQELTTIALGLASQMPNGRIDWVVSCTSPLHWFVHRIVDGLSENHMNCSHHVFPSYEAIPTSLEGISMRSGETVLAFTDVIASGQTAYRMAKLLVDQFGVRMAGLVALADIRVPEDRKQIHLDEIYDGRIVSLYTDAEPARPDLKPTYYVHPETVVPKVAESAPADDFFERNFMGAGPLVERHAYFGNVKRTLDLITKLDALRLGHFQHGSHHSEIFVDVEKIFACREYRELIVTALFRYILAYDVRLVIYPSHSSAYVIVDELKQRFSLDDSSVEFLMACRTFTGAQGTSYALTRFSPHSDPGAPAVPTSLGYPLTRFSSHSNPGWRKYSNGPVLILDDAVCSGETIKSIIAELARIANNYYSDRKSSPRPDAAASKFSIHVVAFLNRLPRGTRDFWGGLAQVTGERVRFSSFFSMPLPAYSADMCPQCRLLKRIEHALDTTTYSFYAKEFMSWWKSAAALVYSDERRHYGPGPSMRNFSSKDILQTAAYICALERHAYTILKGNLFDEADESTNDASVAVRVHVRSRAAFLHGMVDENADDSAEEFAKELDSLIQLALETTGELRSYEGVLDILRILTVRYLRRSPSKDEMARVMECLLTRLSPAFDDRLVAGGCVCVLDSCLKWFSPPKCPEKVWGDIRQSLAMCVRNVVTDGLSARSALMLDWLDTYLAGEGKAIVSVGQAVQLLAEYAKQGRPNHFYGRHELDELREDFEQPAQEAAADAAIENTRRAFVCGDRYLEVVNATRVLRSASQLNEEELRSLQENTITDVRQLRRLCTELLKGCCVREADLAYDLLKEHFLRAYYRWFPRDEPPKAAVVIGHFTPVLRDSLLAAWESFKPQRRMKDVIHIDMKSLLLHNAMRVLADPGMLGTTLRQLLHNIDTLAEKDAPVSVEWRVHLPHATDADTSPAWTVPPGQVWVVVSNTGTPRPRPARVKLRGLAEARMRLSEYGGGLDFAVPESGWSFQVMLKLLVWTEERR